MHVRSADDFAVADRSLSATGVSWIIIGTLVGGVSTIGTVQTAYTHGISAGIFTFGSGISCLLLGLFFAKALREEGVVTVSEYLGRFFGSRFRKYSSAINGLGMFIHVIGQHRSASGIHSYIAGGIRLWGYLLRFAHHAAYRRVRHLRRHCRSRTDRQIKFFMLYLIMIASTGMALYNGGGLTRIIAGLPQDGDMLGFTHYGVKTAAVDLFSMIVGVISTQIYLQAIFAAKDVREARHGAFLSAAVILPIGALGIIVGLYLRASLPGNGRQSRPGAALFSSTDLPPVIAAFFSAGILLIVLGTGAGLVRGVNTNIFNNFLLNRRGE